MSALIPERELTMPPREALSKTNELDQGDWCYRPVLGWIARLRLRAVAAALEGARAPRLLEAGYGSGIFLPELSKHCDALFGVDVHTNGHLVAATMRDEGVTAHLTTGSAIDLPYADGTFDAVVTVSMLEFVPDVPRAVGELLRVTKPTGRVVAVTPRKSAILDFGLKVMTGETGEDTFEGRRGTIVPAFRAQADVQQVVPLPPVVHRALPLYDVVVATPKR